MITLECNYSKKLGLPNFSSHQFSITLRTEISDVNQVHQESARLYRILQTGVDASIKEIGYLPNGNGHGNGNGHNHTPAAGTNGDEWNCSPKQKELILRIIDEHKLDKAELENLAQERFSKGIKQLNKLEASGLIEELLEKYGDKTSNSRNRFAGSRYQKAGGK